MIYTEQYVANPAHIDFQGVMDGVYYSFYMERCRHNYIREVLGFDIEEQARRGIMMVLSGYSMDFYRSLRANDQFTVTCAVAWDQRQPAQVAFTQSIFRDGKKMAQAVFRGTCLKVGSLRPYLPLALEQLARLTSAGSPAPTAGETSPENRQ